MRLHFFIDGCAAAVVMGSLFEPFARASGQ